LFQWRTEKTEVLRAPP